jgi:hypothetical protein
MHFFPAGTNDFDEFFVFNCCGRCLGTGTEQAHEILIHASVTERVRLHSGNADRCGSLIMIRDLTTDINCDKGKKGVFETWGSRIGRIDGDAMNTFERTDDGVGEA